MAAFTINHVHTLTIANWATNSSVVVANSTGGTTSANASDLVQPNDWNATHTGTISVMASDMPEAEFYEPYPLMGTAGSYSTMSAPVNASWYIEPMNVPQWMESGQFMFGMANAAGFLNGQVLSTTPATGSRSQSMVEWFAIYQQGDGDGASSLGLVAASSISFSVSQLVQESSGSATSVCVVSNALTINAPYQWDRSGNISYSNFTTSATTQVLTSTIASTAINSLVTQPTQYVTGSRIDYIPFASTLAAGQFYIAHMIQSTSGSSSAGANLGAGTLFSTQSRLGLAEVNFQAWRQLGKSTTASTTSPQPFKGALRTTKSDGATASLVQSDIAYTTGRLWWAHGERTIG